MSSGDKATIGVLFVAGAGLSAWALLELITGFPSIVEWVKLACGLLCFAGSLLMLAWPTLKEKFSPDPDPEPRQRASSPAKSAYTVEGEDKGFHVEYKILRRSYVTLAAAILSTLVALLMIAFYVLNVASLRSAYGPPATSYSIYDSLVSAIEGGFHLAAVFMGLATASFWAGYFAPVKGLVLAGAILATVACLAMLIWAIFTVPVAILGYVGYARTGRPLAKYIEYQDEKK